MKKIIFIGILVFFISLGVGYFYTTVIYEGTNPEVLSSYEENNIKDYAVVKEHTELKTLEASTQEEEKISPNAKFGKKIYYDECGHFDFKYETLPKELVNLTRQEVEDYFDEYEIEEFSSDNLIITKEINGLCDEHFYVKLGKENIEVQKLNSDGSFSLYQKTDIPREYLPEEDIAMLEEGIYVYGSGMINSILEDYE